MSRYSIDAIFGIESVHVADSSSLLIAVERCVDARAHLRYSDGCRPHGVWIFDRIEERHVTRGDLRRAGIAV